MLLLDHVVPEQWYVVSDVAKIIGWSEDVVYDLIENGYLQAQKKPRTSTKRARIWTGLRVQGCEIIRYVKDNLTELNPNRSRRRVA